MGEKYERSHLSRFLLSASFSQNKTNQKGRIQFRFQLDAVKITRNLYLFTLLLLWAHIFHPFLSQKDAYRVSVNNEKMSCAEPQFRRAASAVPFAHVVCFVTHPTTNGGLFVSCERERERDAQFLHARRHLALRQAETEIGLLLFS